jgi:hypothetical protein
LLAVTLALLSGGFQLAVAFRVDFLLTPRRHAERRSSTVVQTFVRFFRSLLRHALI